MVGSYARDLQRLGLRAAGPPTPSLHHKGGGGRGWAASCVCGNRRHQGARPAPPPLWGRMGGGDGSGSFGGPAGTAGLDLCHDRGRRAGHLRGISAEHLQRGGAARRQKPLAAAIGMPLAFEMHPLGVLACEHVSLEVIIRRSGAETLQMRLISGGQFGFLGGNTATGAGQDQHDGALHRRRGRGRGPRTHGGGEHQRAGGAACVAAIGFGWPS